MPVDTTGNHRIDTATAEIAGYLRDAHVGLSPRREQEFYDMAMALRDEIMLGTMQRDGTLPKWTPANNGTGKRMYFLIRGIGQDEYRVPLRSRYHYGPSGKLVRYASIETAQRAADKLNAAEAS